MTDNPFESRREALRREMAKEDIRALLISHAPNRYYLSGFELHDPQPGESAGWLLVTDDGRDKLLTDPRYLEAARRLWPAEDVFIYKHPKLENVRDFVAGLGHREVSFEASSLSYKDFAGLADKLTLAPAPPLVEKLREIKDEDELKAMNRSLALNHSLFSELPSLLEPGLAEKEIAWEIEKRYRERGATGLAFDSIVGVGPNAALPHAIPGDTPVRENDLVLVDMGCRVDDYCSDQTRTFWVGEEPAEHFRLAKERVREAQDAAIAALRPGMVIADAYATSLAVFRKYKVEDHFTHALGHGIGLETHESPSLNVHNTDTFKPGMVVTVEPGLYYHDWGGIRWEYMVLITEDGAERL